MHFKVFLIVIMISDSTTVNSAKTPAQSSVSTVLYICMIHRVRPLLAIRSCQFKSILYTAMQS